jgi:hypothetical protein
MHGRIRSHQQDRDRVEQERCNERYYDMYRPYYDQPTRHHSPTRTRDLGGIKPFSHDLRKVIWPSDLKPSVIDKYGGSTNPDQWLEVYQLAIEAVGGDSYVMANYLPIVLYHNLVDETLDFLSVIVVRPLLAIHQQLQSHLRGIRG